MTIDLKQTYGYLFEDQLIDEITQIGIVNKFDPGDYIIELGDTISQMPLIIEGAIKVLREDQNGDELLLYFLEVGDTCAMTLSCCLGLSKSKIRAIAETPVKLIMVPINKMELWITTYKSWRNFVFDSYNSRLLEMLDAIDALAFMNLEERLTRYLTDKVQVNHSNILSITHQAIALELNTSRVVISRILKAMEIKGKIKLDRNKIKLIA